MSSAKPKAVSEINLEEFERRLRAASSRQTSVEDPLAELTRLVDTIAAERQSEEKIVEFSPPRQVKPERLAPPAEARRQAELARQADAARKADAARQAELARRAEAARQAEAARRTEAEPAPEAARSVEPQRRAAPPAALVEARAPVAPAPPEPPQLRPMFEEGRAEQPASPRVADEADVDEPVARERPPRARSWYLKVGGLTALAAAMAVGAVVLKVGVPGRPKTPPMILAAEGPTKVAPPTESAVQSPSDSGALLLKDSAAPATPAPIKIVSKEEQPVDLAARPAVTVAPAGAPPPGVATPPSSPVSSTSPIEPTTDTQVLATSEPAAPPPAPLLSTSAKPVKTVSVRPDGTLISIDTAQAAPVPAPSPVAPPPAAPTMKPDVAASPQAATPTIDLPPKPAKSGARVAIAKTDTTVPADSATGSQPIPAARAEKPAKPPTKLRPPAVEAAVDAKPAADAAPAEGGGWAVQFAAPSSESDAESEISMLKSKYADALGGAALAVHKAEVHGSTKYRVRAGGMTKAEAVALCSKVKAAGGDCFPAKH